MRRWEYWSLLPVFTPWYLIAGNNPWVENSSTYVKSRSVVKFIFVNCHFNWGGASYMLLLCCFSQVLRRSSIFLIPEFPITPPSLPIVLVMLLNNNATFLIWRSRDECPMRASDRDSITYLTNPLVFIWVVWQRGISTKLTTAQDLRF